MKKCPFCAESIQDAAIVCRYCGRDIPATVTVEETRERTLSVTHKYTKLFKSLKQLEPKHRQNYPLSVDRRPAVIASIIENIEAQAFDPTNEVPRGPILEEHVSWWRFSVSADVAVQHTLGNWHRSAERLLHLEEEDDSFPSDDEWLSAVAYIIVKAMKHGYKPPPGTPDYVGLWKGLQNAKKWDRIIQGISPIGAVRNIVGWFSAEKPPKQGTIQWQVFRHAYAQLEATLLLQST